MLFLLATVAALVPSALHAQWRRDGVPLCTVSLIQQNPAGISDGAGGAIVVWEDLREFSANGYDLYAQHVLASGVVDPTWPGNGLAVSNPGGNQAFPSIVSDGEGGAFVAWEDTRDLGITGYDVYAQHLLSIGTVDPAWPVNGRAVITLPPSGPGDAGFRPAIVADGAGGAIVAWFDNRTSPTTGYDIFASHLLPDGTLDPAWPAGGTTLSTAPLNQMNPVIASDGAGGAIVAWESQSTGTYATRVLASGVVAPSWPVNGRHLTTSSFTRQRPRIIAIAEGGSPTNGAIVAWEDYRAGSTNGDIYAQHVLSNGALDPAWQPDGLAVCDTLGQQQRPVLGPDGGTGAILAWQDARYGASDVFAQHVQSGAVDPAWPARGRAICLAAGDQLFPAIVSDGLGGVIVAWQDARGAGVDIYEQRIQSGGTVDPAWPGDGRLVCGYPFDQYLPTIVTDGNHGAIVAWQDGRGYGTGTQYDIYAQRTYSNGGVAAAMPANRLAGLQLLPAFPNPARSVGLTIPIVLPSARPVSVTVLDLTGRHVRTLADRILGEGRQHVTWDGRDAAGAPLAGGVYFIRAQAGPVSLTQRVVLLR